MVLTYTKENLGTDFTIFLWLSIFSFACFAMTSLVMIYYCLFKMKKRDDKIYDIKAINDDITFRNSGTLRVGLSEDRGRMIEMELQ